MAEYKNEGNSFAPSTPAKGLGMESVVKETTPQATVEPTQAEREAFWQQPGVLTCQAGADGSLTLSREGGKMSSSEAFKSDTPGVLATAKTKMGMPLLSSEVTDDTLLFVDGVEMKAVDAARLGFVTRYSATEYDENEGYEQAAQEKAQAKAQANPELEVTGSFISDPTAQTLGNLEAQFGRSTIKQGVLSAGAALVGKDVNKAKAAVEAFASQIGQEPAQANQILSGVLTDILDRVSATTAIILGKQGNPVEARQVVEFMRHCSPEVKSSLIVRAVEGDTSLVKDLAERFNQSRRN